MNRRSFVTALLAAFTTGAGYLLGLRKRDARAATQPTSNTAMMEGGKMGGGMMSGDMGGMMSSENRRGPMRSGMALFMRHAEIQRTVTDIPGGVRAETVSANPKTAALIQQHVADMYQRLDANKPFPYPASRSVPALFAHSTGYQRKLDVLPDGVAVTETSADPDMVNVIRAHAREITGFVQEGMPAMMRNMMQQ